MQPALITCPDCGTEGQEAGKFCENCGRFLSAAADTASAASGPPTTPTSSIPASSGVPASAGSGASTASGPQTSASLSAQFAVVGPAGVEPSNGFTIRRVGEFLVGRPDADTGVVPDVDLRQWVEPIDIGGQQMYLVHRVQCYLGLTPDGTATIRSCPGAELDTLVKLAIESTFVPLQQLGTVRAALADPAGAFPLNVGDQIFMGDPEAVQYFQTGDPTARGSYLVLELVAPESRANSGAP